MVNGELKKEKIKCGIIGGSGYTGQELIKILGSHDKTDLCVATSRKYEKVELGKLAAGYYDKGNSAKYFQKEITKNLLNELDLIFLCLPPLDSMKYFKENLAGYNGNIIDVGSDFRLKKTEDYKKWYKADHLMGDYLDKFVYGLTEVYRSDIKGAKYIANPGCYPTSILLALAPVLKENKIKINNINIDSKSGVSGAGRKLKDNYLFCSINENFYAYSPNMHRHISEIEQEIKNISGEDMKISFTPHLLPVSRGIFSSIYCFIDKSKDIKNVEEYMVSKYQDYYKDSCFVKINDSGVPNIASVVRTNNCEIGVFFDSRTSILKIFSAIDNLVKGAAGQAVQNMNVAFGFNESEGLL